MAVVASDSGELNEALQVMDKEYAVAEKTTMWPRWPRSSGQGNILAEIPRYDEAQRQFDRSSK